MEIISQKDYQAENTLKWYLLRNWTFFYYYCNFAPKKLSFFYFAKIFGTKSYIDHYKIQNHLFFGQFSLSIDIYIQTYFNIYLVLVLASRSISPIHFNTCRFLCWHAITFSKINFNAYTPCYLPNLFQFLIGSFAGCPA